MTKNTLAGALDCAGRGCLLLFCPLLDINGCRAAWYRSEGLALDPPPRKLLNVSNILDP